MTRNLEWDPFAFLQRRRAATESGPIPSPRHSGAFGEVHNNAGLEFDRDGT